MISLIGKNPPAETIDNAQIAFANGETWVVISPFSRLSGVTSIHPMPAVDCPIVDTTHITDEERFANLMRQYITPRGCIDVPMLITRLELIGAVAQYAAGNVLTSIDKDIPETSICHNF
jgi:hypothetical protein